VAAERTRAEGPPLMEVVVERGNVWAAYRKVVENKGAPGVDGVRVSEFKDWLKEHWPTVRAALLAGRYIPQAVRAVEIPKPSGDGMRLLGIPTLVDRLIQQALLQALQPIFEPGFSESSYGFRPGRNAIRRCEPHKGMCGPASVLSSILIWRSSSTESITTF
jgi:RNA-directed DNA polymerase